MKRTISTSLVLVVLSLTTSVTMAGNCHDTCRKPIQEVPQGPVRQTLQQHVHADGRFEALMPGNTTDQTVEGESLLDTQFISEATVEGTIFQVRVQLIVPIDLGDAGITKSFTDNFVNQARSQLESNFGTASEDKAVELNGMTGSEFVYEIPANRSASGENVTLKRRVMFNGQRLFIVTVAGAPEVVNSETASQFLDSVQQTNAD